MYEGTMTFQVYLFTKRSRPRLYFACPQTLILWVANGKSETRWDFETGILKSETETEKCIDLIEKQICDRQTQNLRLPRPISR